MDLLSEASPDGVVIKSQLQGHPDSMESRQILAALLVSARPYKSSSRIHYCPAFVTKMTEK